MVDTFNLIDEPWIAVRGPSGAELVSLRDAFARSREFGALAGDLPTQDVAILRLMLAVLHRAAEPMAGSPQERWRVLWEVPSLPMQWIDDYLEQWRDRFDLLDPKAPFMQVADLTASKTSGLVKLIPEVPDGEQFFTMRAGPGLVSLSFAEAARWVVHCHAYDISGIKTGAAGDVRVKGGKGYPIGTGWSGRCGLVVVEHETLSDLILLNYRPVGRGRDDEDDKPIWERDVLTAAPEPGHLSPRGPADLFTWPIRRVRLHHDGTRVTDVLICNGDPLPWHNQQHLEPMCAFRRSAAQEKKLRETPVYMPHRHDPSRAVWRGLGAILVETPDGGAPRDEAPERLIPGTLEWLATMSGEGVLDADLPVRLRAVGLAYGPQDSSIAASYDDSIRMHLSVATNPYLKHAAIAASSVADLAVRHLGDLASAIARAAGREPEGPRDDAREVAYARLDAPYRQWLASLSGHADLTEADTRWQLVIRGHLLALAGDIVAAGGEAAWKGREVLGHHIDTSLAHLRFLAGLAKTLPLADQPTDSKETS